jgi:pyruvate dehydrogenase E2 component (dihydrolipoamide acetyltransferase)
MTTKVIMERYGWLTKEGKIIKWFKEEGDNVEKDEVLLDLETEKVVVQVKAPSAGTLLKIYSREGATVPVGDVIAIIGGPGETLPEVTVERGEERFEAKTRIKSSPAARRLAKEHGIDLSSVVGTGPAGRITERDVLGPIEHSVDNGHTESISESVAKIIPLVGMRKVIADRMSLSAKTTASVTAVTEIDMTNVVDFREKLLAEFERKANVRLTFTDILIKAVAKALEQHPLVNSVFVNDKIYEMSDINIGLAVSMEAGVVVPVIHEANKKSLLEIAMLRSSVIERLKQGRVDEFGRGTFTITNVGMHGIDIETPIINPPQSAILGIGRIVEKPVVVDEKISIRSMMYLSLTFDHRVFDGVPAAQFLQSLRAILENPQALAKEYRHPNSD